MKRYLSNFTLFQATLFVVLFVTFAGVVVAWSGPSSTAPNGNVSAPINVGSTSQIKSGSLGADALAIYGNAYVQDNLGVGYTTASQKLDVNGNVKGSGFCISTTCIDSWNDVKPSAVKLYKSSGTFSTPSGVTKAIVIVIGGGGDGGHGHNKGDGGGSTSQGGAGGDGETRIGVVTLSGSMTVTVKDSNNDTSFGGIRAGGGTDGGNGSTSGTDGANGSTRTGSGGVLFDLTTSYNDGGAGGTGSGTQSSHDTSGGSGASGAVLILEF